VSFERNNIHCKPIRAKHDAGIIDREDEIGVIMENYGELWELCTKNKRIVPQPQKWNELYRKLKNTRKKPGGGFEPPAPLILAAWYESSVDEKQYRLCEHLRWAIAQDQEEEIVLFLKSLKEEDWVHQDEF